MITSGSEFTEYFYFLYHTPQCIFIVFTISMYCFCKSEKTKTNLTGALELDLDSTVTVPLTN